MSSHLSTAFIHDNDNLFMVDCSVLKNELKGLSICYTNTFKQLVLSLKIN